MSRTRPARATLADALRRCRPSFVGTCDGARAPGRRPRRAGRARERSAPRRPDRWTRLRAERLRRHRQVLEPVVALRRAGAGRSSRWPSPRPVAPAGTCWLTVDDGGRPSGDRSRLMPAIHRPLGDHGDRGCGRRPLRGPADGAVRTALPPGYHRLRLEGPGIEATSLLVVAPPLPGAGPGLGGLPPAARPAHRDRLGGRELPALAELVRLGGPSWAASSVADAPALPVLSCDAPADSSPYLPVTRLGWNELYVDPMVLPELEPPRPRPAALVASRGVPAPMTGLPAVGPPSTTAAVGGLVRQVARAAGRGVSRRPSRAPRRAGGLRGGRHPELVAYARVPGGRQPTTSVGSAGWPLRPGLAPPDARPVAPRTRAPGPLPPATPSGSADAAGEAARDGLYLDLPVGVAPGRLRPAVEPDASSPPASQGGAPPDGFFDPRPGLGVPPAPPARVCGTRLPLPDRVLRHAMSPRRAGPDRPRDGAAPAVLGARRARRRPTGPTCATAPTRCGRSSPSRPAGRAVRSSARTSAPCRRVRRGMAQDGMLRSWVLRVRGHRRASPSPTRRSCRWPPSAPTTSPASPTSGERLRPGGRGRRAWPGGAGRTAGGPRRAPAPTATARGCLRRPASWPAPGPAGPGRPRGPLARAPAAQPARHRARRPATGGTGPARHAGRARRRTRRVDRRAFADGSGRADRRTPGGLGSITDETTCTCSTRAPTAGWRRSSAPTRDARRRRRLRGVGAERPAVSVIGDFNGWARRRTR